MKQCLIFSPFSGNGPDVLFRNAAIICFFLFAPLFWTRTGGTAFAQTPGEWTWMNSSNVNNFAGSYGTLGVSSAANRPPAIYEPCEWTDNNGIFWLFGGLNTSNSYYSALWKFDPNTASATYYRLNQADFDGKYEYFGPISVVCSASDEWNLILQNIPATDELLATFFSPEDDILQITIYDLLGRLLIRDEFPVSKGSNLLKLPLKNINSGIYFVKVFDMKKQLTKKFVKL